ncbi:MAG TPA: hypothetical protein VF618_09100 [Thermoanaerobaculia bacterium]
MRQPSPSQIRRLFLTPPASADLRVAAELLGLAVADVEQAIANGEIVAVRIAEEWRVGRDELIAAAMRLWDQTAIEDALGEDAAAVLPEDVRLVLMHVRLPRYQRDLFAALARKAGTSVDDVLARELEAAAAAHLDDLGKEVPALRIGMGWL